MLGNLLKFIVSSFLIYLLFNAIDFERVISILMSANKPLYFFAVVFIFTIAFALAAIKWQQILAEFGIREKFKHLFKLNLVAFFFSMTFFGQLSGEVMKTYKISKGRKEKIYYVRSVILDRLTGLVVIIVLSLIYLKGEINSSAVLILVIFLMLFVLILNKSKKLFGKFRLYKLIFEEVSSFKKYSLSFWIKIAVLSVLFHITTVYALWLMAQAIDINISYFVLIWVYAIVSLVIFLPVTIAGIGLREASFSVVFPLIGFSAHQGVALSLLLFIAQLFYAFLGAVIYSFDR